MLGTHPTRYASTETIPTANQPKADNPNSYSTTTCVSYLWERFRSQNLSKEASKLLTHHSNKRLPNHMTPLFGKWVHWCHEGSSNPLSEDEMEMVNFLLNCSNQDTINYHSLNAYRSAMSSVYEKVDGYEGQHPLVTRLIKGAFHE